jgi:small-conductance mechanosensitive channel
MERHQSTKKEIKVIRQGLVWLLLCAWVPCAIAEQASSAASKPLDTAASAQELPEEISAPPAVVTIEGRPLFTVYESIGPLTPQARAERIEQRILAIAQEERSVATAPATHFEIRPGWTEIYVGDQIVMAITDTDAQKAGKTRQELATLYAAAITDSVATFHREHGWRFILRGVLRAVFTTLIFVAALWLLNRMRTKIRDRVEKHLRTREGLEQKPFWDVALTYAAPIVLALGAILKWCLIIAVIESYLTVTLGFFSSTREMSLTVTKWFLSQLESMAKAAVAYIPNLVVLVVIGLLTYYLFRLFRLVFAQIKKGELKIRGFYADWADPTEKLVRMLVFILALVVAFPYLPGAKSPAFQGISIFLGVLLSLGSSSAIANALAGIILTYMRSFLVGDWVQIGDTMGEVAEKTLLVTRILTPKAEIITIPNAAVMSGSVKNYSVEAKKSGVIFHTSVSIGYDAPWRTVHRLLIDAALATKHVLRQPSPFVLQNRLDDFYVFYELNAYTDTPSRMLNIYSDLHQNIQDKFNEAGVEICSPHFSSLRDGNRIAIPEQYIEAGYRVPGFRVGSLKKHDTADVATESVQSQRAG